MVGGTGGIGHGVAAALAARGADIFLLGGRSAPRMERSLAELRASGAKAEGRLLDLETEIEAAVEFAREGAFDMLVVSFGPFLQSPLAKTSTAEWLRMASLNLVLPGALATAILPGMEQRKWGRMVFFGGTGTDTIKGYKTNAPYAAAKTGLGVLARSIALQHSGDGIAAFVVCPGLVETEYIDAETASRLSAKAPGGRLIETAALGETIAELASRDPCLVSGSIIAMDAGLDFAKGS